MNKLDYIIGLFFNFCIMILLFLCIVFLIHDNVIKETRILYMQKVIEKNTTEIDPVFGEIEPEWVRALKTDGNWRTKKMGIK